MSSTRSSHTRLRAPPTRSTEPSGSIASRPRMGTASSSALDPGGTSSVRRATAGSMAERFSASTNHSQAFEFPPPMPATSSSQAQTTKSTQSSWPHSPRMRLTTWSRRTAALPVGLRGSLQRSATESSRSPKRRSYLTRFTPRRLHLLRASSAFDVTSSTNPIRSSRRSERTIPASTRGSGDASRSIATRSSFATLQAANIAAVCLLKDDAEYGLPRPRTKLATFKVAAEYRGQRYGEQLLKAALLDAESRSRRAIYLTVFERHDDLLGLFADLGFENSRGAHGSRRASLGEARRPVPNARERARRFRGQPSIRAFCTCT